jgi:hypothetical protein
VSSATSAALLLAVVALSDGLRLLPAGAIVACRVLFGDWAVDRVNAEQRVRPRLITWCSPLALPVVLHGGVESSLSLGRRLTRFRARMRRTRSLVGALRLGGVLILTTLIGGVPWLTARWGVWGFLLGLSALLWLCLVQGVTAMVAFRRAGVGVTRALLTTVKYLWPFTGPRAAEDVLHQVARDVPPLILLRELLPGDAFGHFVRPLLFDAVVRGAQTPAVAELRAHLGAASVASIVNEPPRQRDGDAFCPRCGASFSRRAGPCSDCAEVELRPRPAS